MPAPTTELQDPKLEHALRGVWTGDEARQRASFLATRRDLIPFLVPHRHEGDKTGPQLRRAKFGYGVGLNQGLVGEVMGHVQSARTSYKFGALAGTEGAELRADAPDGSAMFPIWGDFSKTGTTWRNFFNDEVLERILTSVGGFVLVDADSTPTLTMADDAAIGKRPFGSFVPYSAVVDYQFTKTGFQWISIVEGRDERQPGKDPSNLPGYNRATGLVEYQVLYELDRAGNSWSTRFDAEGKPVGDAVDYGKLVDLDGQPTLPLVLARYGRHPHSALTRSVGSGFLMSLADIVIDLFNSISETREGYRDSVFQILLAIGLGEAELDELLTYLNNNARMLPLGANEKADIKPLNPSPVEVEAGLKLQEAALTAWAKTARRNAEQVESKSARSGESFSQEFEVDMRPTLTKIASTLDAIERNVLWIVAQFVNKSATTPDVNVERSTDFPLEETSRIISRQVKEARAASLPVPAEFDIQAMLAIIEESGLIDLDAEGEDGRTKREQFTDEIRNQIETRQLASQRAADLALIGAGA